MVILALAACLAYPEWSDKSAGTGVDSGDTALDSASDSASDSSDTSGDSADTSVDSGESGGETGGESGDSGDTGGETGCGEGERTTAYEDLRDTGGATGLTAEGRVVALEGYGIGRLGDSVVALGDVDDDGFDDVALGAVDAATYRGAVFVVFGDASPTSRVLDASRPDADVAVVIGGGDLGAVMRGVAGSLWVVSAEEEGGDCPDDLCPELHRIGFPDLAGAGGTIRSFDGEVSDGAPFASLADVTVSTALWDAGQPEGAAEPLVALVVDAPNYVFGYDADIDGPGTEIGDGTVYLFEGSADLAGSRVEDSAFATLTAPAATSAFGAAVLAQDLDGDGLDDLVVSSPAEGRGVLRVWADGVDAEPSCALTSSTSEYYLGWFLLAGDADGDGGADLFVGTGLGDMPAIQIFDIPTGCTDGAITPAGEVELSRGPLGLGATPPIDLLDFDNDCVDDLLVGHSENASDPGSVELLYGPLRGHVVGDDHLPLVGVPTFGIALAGAGDVNGDGADDAYVGASWSDLGGDTQNPSGTAWLLLGD